MQNRDHCCLYTPAKISLIGCAMSQLFNRQLQDREQTRESSRLLVITRELFPHTLIHPSFKLSTFASIFCAAPIVPNAGNDKASKIIMGEGRRKQKGEVPKAAISSKHGKILSMPRYPHTQKNPMKDRARIPKANTANGTKKTSDV